MRSFKQNNIKKNNKNKKLQFYNFFYKIKQCDKKVKVKVKNHSFLIFLTDSFEIKLAC